MDDATIEMLSRYIDGDLDPADEEGVRRRLNGDPVLRSKMESLQQLRAAVVRLAESEEVPADLDALVEPLRRGRPEEVAARPWARWLATAAVAVLGLSVIIEVNQRSSRQPARETPRSETRRHAEPTERFSLAPLPTSSVPAEDQLLGVSERLLASPIPEMEIDESPPLHVLGPLEEPPTAENDVGREKTGLMAAPVAPGDPAPAMSTAAVPSAPDGTSEKRDGDRSAAPPSAALVGAPANEKRSHPSPPGGPGVIDSIGGRAQLFVFNAGETAWQSFEPNARCTAGRYTIRIRIGGGIVREVWPIGTAASGSTSPAVCAAGLVSGMTVGAMADGEYQAQVVVEAFAPTGD